MLHSDAFQADLKTFAAFDCYGASVLTGLTAQNTTGVQAVHEVPSEFVLKQVCRTFTGLSLLTMENC